MLRGVCVCVCMRVQVLAEFCAQDEDGQTPLLFAARSGSGAVFRQALEALLARASPHKVCTSTCHENPGLSTPHGPTFQAQLLIK